MRDYHTSRTHTPIAKLPTAKIESFLRDGFRNETGQASDEALIERLRLELYIRQNNLRVGLE